MSNVTAAARANLFLAPTAFILAIVSSIVIARCFGPETYADYATLTSLLAWLLLLSESGCNIGLSRYLPEAGTLQAQGTLYRTLQVRRWTLVAGFALLLALGGPVWAIQTGLSPEAWGTGTFLLIGLLGAIMLHNQLANNSLMSIFLHRRMLLVSQAMTIVRAITLAVLAGLMRNPVHLILALTVLAAIEAFLMHRNAQKNFAQQDQTLPKGFVTKAQLHGMVAQFDKMTTALGGGAFLVLLLTGSHSRSDLAMLAIATDLVQKMLGVLSLPFANLISPMLNESRDDRERFTRQVSRLGSLSIILFSIVCSGAISILNASIPLIFGKEYMAAVLLAYVWIIPVCFEACVRMVWGAACLALDQRQWLMLYNAVFGLITIFALLLCHESRLEQLLGVLGAVRILFTGFLLHKAHTLNLLPPEARPLRIIFFSAFCCAVALGCQYGLHPSDLWSKLFAGVSIFCFLLGMGLRYLNLVPPLAHGSLQQMAGRLQPIVLFFIPNPVKKN